MGVFQNIIDFFRGKYHYAFNFKIFRDKNKCYEHIISLGYNCEIAYRIYQYFKFEESSLFNWSYHKKIDDLIFALENFNLIGSKDFTYNELWECDATKIFFHGKSVLNTTFEETQEKDFLKKDKQDLIGKIKYLKEKFIKILNDNSKKLYIYKIQKEDLNEEIDEKILKLKRALKNLGGNNFDLLVLSIKEKRIDELLKSKEYFSRNLKCYPPNNRVVDWKYNRNGFKKIFDEFYCIKPKNYKKIKKYKFE